MDKILRAKIRKKIPHGDIQKIADDNQLTRQSIYNFFKDGKSKRVEKAILNYVEDSLKNKEEAQKKLSEFVNN